MKRIIVIAVAALALAAPGAASAASFEVNTTEDVDAGTCSVAEPGCSLRDAVEAVNSSADSENTIVVPAGNYSISRGNLDVEKEGTVTIRGAGAASTIVDAHQSSRVFDLASDTDVLEGLTVTGGLAAELASEEEAGDGGGILAYEAGEVVLREVVVSGNAAAKNGGGISGPPEGVNIPNFTIERSTISGNRVEGGLVEGLGGGIYVLGNLTLVNSTVAGNSAETTVAGLVSGGGVLVALEPTATEGNQVSIVNSTISGNRVATGGIGGGLAAYNPTAGVTSALSIENTILAGNEAGGEEADCGSLAMVSSKSNIAGDESCMFSDGGSQQKADPKLGPLQGNGGPTPTMALAADSPAIDRGSNDGCPATDQRGVKRPQGSACDVGAYEREAAGPAGSGGPAPAPQAANLRLRIKPKPRKARVGRRLGFVLTVTNRGPAAAPGSVLTGTAPALTRKVSAPKVGGRKACKLGKAKRGKRKLTCRLGAIPAGKSKRIRITVKTRRPGRVRLRARVRSSVTDPNPKDNKAAAAVRVMAAR